MAKKKVNAEVVAVTPVAVNDTLMDGMALTVPVVGEVAEIEENMVAYGGEKNADIIELSTEDRHELAVLFVVKGGMSGISKKADDMDKKLKEVGAPWMLARGVKKVKLEGIGTIYLVEGKNTSISADNLRKVLIGYVPASVVNVIIEKVTKATPYTTLMFKAD
jgi:hypothetical protein